MRYKASGYVKYALPNSIECLEGIGCEQGKGVAPETSEQLNGWGRVSSPVVGVRSTRTFQLFDWQSRAEPPPRVKLLFVYKKICIELQGHGVSVREIVSRGTAARRLHIQGSGLKKTCRELDVTGESQAPCLVFCEINWFQDYACVGEQSNDAGIYQAAV